MPGYDFNGAQEKLVEEQRKEQEENEKRALRINKYLYERQVKLRMLMVWGFVLSSVLMILVFCAFRNPKLFVLDESTLEFINQAFNSVVLLTIPFLLGGCGAIARLLLSGVKVIDQLTLIGGSALMSCFSWVGIKSGVLVSVIAPHLTRHQITDEQIVNVPTSFYTMALVAILVGMFSTNLYLFISQRVEQITKNRESKEV